MRWILLLLTLHSIAYADVEQLFITKENKPTKPLQELLALDGLYNPADTLDAIVRKTQKAWIQVQQGKDNKERSDLKDSEERPEVIAACIQLGIFNESTPRLKHYDYGICLGAFLGGVQYRVAQLIEYWKEGVRFDSLIFLTGERSLRKEAEDSLEVPDGTPYETEYDMCKVVWAQADVPDAMRKALEGKVIFVNAKRPAKDMRPSTRDLYTTWLNEYHPKPGTILAQSHPIFWCYQQLVAENILPSQFIIDTCAKQATEALRKKYQGRLVSIVHDTIAKCLYEIQRKKMLTSDQNSASVQKTIKT